MNCDCIEQIAEQKHKFQKDRAVKWAVLMDQGSYVHLKTFKTRIGTFSTVEICEEGRKRTRKIKIRHNFCPFCGQPEEFEDDDT